MIKSFLTPHTKKLFLGDGLTKKDRINLGALKIDKAFQRLALLDQADEKLLLSTPAVHYRSLKGTTRCSIDTEARNSKWRITFAWENDEKADVELVLLADAH